jgi:hypothetical protein
MAVTMNQTRTARSSSGRCDVCAAGNAEGMDAMKSLLLY